MPDTATLSTPLAYALAYAAIGWHVLPLEPNAKQPLGRLVPRGMLDATTDAATIRQWWGKVPAAGIGIALAPSGLVAIDVDPRNGGTATFDDLQAAHGSLRSEVMAMTGGGGEHHVFVVPAGHQVNLPGTLGPGVDLKANGYIVVEPSLHPSGKAYAWEWSSNPLDGVAPSPLPDWLRSLRVDLHRPRTDPAAKPVDARQAADVREALFVLEADDYDTWIKAGMALHATGWGHPAYAIWCAWSQQSPKFDATVQRHKWESFSAERDQALTLRWVFAEAQRSGWRNPAAVTARVSPLPAAQATRLTTGEPGASVLTTGEEEPPGLRYITGADVDMADRVFDDELVEGVIGKESMVVVYGDSNSGKTFLAIDIAAAIERGEQWMGRHTTPGLVLYLATEAPGSVELRVAAYKRQHSADLANFVIVQSPVNLFDSAADVQAVIDLALAVEKRCGRRVSLIVGDTLARLAAGANENSGEDMTVVLRNAEAIRRPLGASFMWIHHSGKDAARGARGWSGLRAAIDTEIEVTVDEAMGTRCAEVTKQRDLPGKGDRYGFRLEVVRMGVNKWGNERSTCVVLPTDAPAKPASKGKRPSEIAGAITEFLTARGAGCRVAQMVNHFEGRYVRTSVYREVKKMLEAGLLIESTGIVALPGKPGANN